MKASHKRHEVKVGYQSIILERGQFIFGRKNASSELRLGERTIRTCLNSLKNDQQLAIKTTNKFSVITICNWDTYQNTKVETDQQNDQQTVQPPTSNRPATDQQPTTNNNGKNGENGKNDQEKEREAHTPDELWGLEKIISIASSPDVGVNRTMASEFFDYYNAQGWQKGKTNHVMRSVSEIKSALRQWKTREPSMGKTMPAGQSSTPSRPIPPRTKSFDDLAQEAARDLWGHREDDAGFKRCLSVWRDKTKDMGTGPNGAVVDEAMAIIKRKKTKN